MISNFFSCVLLTTTTTKRYVPELGGYLSESQSQDLIEEQAPIPASQGKVRYQYQQPPPSSTMHKPDSGGGGRKKNSFEDDDESEIGLSSSTYVKKEYYLKGGDGVHDTSIHMAAATTTCGIEQTMISQQQTGSTSNTLPKSNLKGSIIIYLNIPPTHRQTHKKLDRYTYFC